MTPAIPACPSTQLQALRDLDAAIMHHTIWLKVLHRTLISGESPDPLDLRPDAHRHCQFGCWFYGASHADLPEDPWLHNIGAFHQSMHDQARALLTHKSQGSPIAAGEYDAFMDMAIRFKLEVRALQTEIIDRVCEVDHLTGARNRNSMHHKLLEEHERMLRAGHPCCLCMMDIDHFKRINDEHGHVAGDMVLQATVRFFGERLRKYDSLFRYGGEEFLFCLPNIEPGDAHALMDRLRQELALFPVEIKGKEPIHTSASFGIAMMNVDEPVEDAIEKADHALLCAKAGGRNRVCLWNV